MSVFDLFSKRQKQLRGEVPDVYQYTDLPHEFRVQFIHILRDVLGEEYSHRTAAESLKAVHDILCREYGLFSLTPNEASYFRNLAEWFLEVKDTERCLDFIEISLRVSVLAHSKWQYAESAKAVSTPTQAGQELNARFREHGIGYQFESGEIIRVDSQIVHDQVVRPTLHLLRQKDFAGANEEYLRAHEHYRHRRYRESINECLKAFESVLKVICTKKNWTFKETDPAKTLIDIVFANGLIPPFLVSEFGGLRSLLESGLPTTRNRTSSHGQGAVLKDVPAYLAAFALHASAANILLVVEAAGL